MIAGYIQKMKQFLILLALLPVLLSAGIKLDIDGRDAGMTLKAVKCSPKMSFQHPAWAKSQGYLIFTRGGNKAWGRYFFTFVSDKDGELTISRRGFSSKRDINHWMLYKEVEITGAEVVFHAASKAAVRDLPRGEERCGHYHSVIDYVKVKANVPVTVKFMAKREGSFPAGKFSPEEYKLPVPTRVKPVGMRFAVDGLGSKIPVEMSAPAQGYKRRTYPIRYGKGTGKVELFTPAFIGKEWKKLSFSFMPRLSGDVSFARSNISGKRGIAQWMEFRNFKITGAERVRELKTGVNKSPAGLERMCDRAPLYDMLAVKKNLRVTVEFEVRSAQAEPESQYPNKDWFVIQGRHKTGWQDNKIKVLADGEKGDAYGFYGEGKNALDVPGVVFSKGRGGKDAGMEFAVPVEVLEEEGMTRNAPIKFGFPLPQKKFYNTDHIAVFNADGKVIPANISVTGYWPDNSVKWLLIEFNTLLKAGEKRVFTVKGGKNIRPAVVKNPRVIKQQGKYLISAGELSFTVDPDSASLLKSIVFRGKNFGDLKLLANNDGTSRIFSIKEEKPGSIRIDGNLISDRYIGGFTARVHFSQNSPVLRTAVTFRADNLAYETSELDSLHLLLTSGSGRLSSGGMFQGNDLKHSVNGKIKNGFMPDGDTFSCPSGKVAFALEYAGMRYPKAFAVNKSGLDIQLLPPQPSKDFNSDLPGYLRFPFSGGRYRLMTGMHFTEEVVFDFSGSAVSARDIVAVIPPAWYAKTDAVRGVFADDTVKKFDDLAVAAFYDHLKLKKYQREYGFLNFGDWFGERGGGNWGNNEYDFAWGLLNLFARTGNRDVYRLGMQAARHQSDVDIIHYTPFWNLLGGNHMHCVGHTGMRCEPGNKPVAMFGGIYRQGYAFATNGHSWTGGMFTAFLMSGKADIGDSAKLLAEHLILHSGSPYRNQGNPRSHGWMLEGLMQAYDATGEARYLKAAKSVADGFFKCQALEKGGAWPFNLPGGYLRGGRKSGFGTSCFQMGVVIQALHHYALRANRPEIKKNLAAAAGWMRKSFIPGAVGWPYVAGWDGEAYWPPSSNLNMLMLAAAGADGSPEGYPILLNGIGLYMLRGVGSVGIGKNLAMDLVFAPATFEMLKKMPGKKELSLQKFMDSYANLSHLMRLRGPEKLKLDVTLRRSSVQLNFERNFYNPRRSAVQEYELAVKDKTGKTVYSFKGNVDDRTDVRKSCLLRGKKGDRFEIVITDNISSYWDVYTSDKTPVRVHLNKSSQFANGVSLLFGVRVPAGVKKFTVKYTGCHLGEYGIVALDAAGKILQTRSKYNGKLQLPWLKDAGSSRCDVTIERKDSTKAGYFRFFTWSSGDILLDLDGVPPVIEIIR